MISPDNFAETRRLRTRWLYTLHKTLDDDQIQSLCDQRWRQQFDQMEASLRNTNRPQQKTPTSVAPRAAEPTGQVAESTRPLPDSDVDHADALSTEPAQANGVDLNLEEFARILAKKASMTTAEFVERANQSDSKGRALLKELQRAGLSRATAKGANIYTLLS